MTTDVEHGPGWYDADTATLGDRITGAREASGLSQSELARRLGVKLATIRTWENDQAEPRANKLQMLAGMLNVSIMWLLTGRGDGLDGPEEHATLPDDLVALLDELRQTRLEQARLADRMGRLEKRLRLALSQGV
ncbi:helix-turn-helix domain-containing protein [Rhodobacterales bacterium LSUCC0031]|nr:helix-turn-helix domain-containing protein [Rhodobacterales bacterium LSUCC0031]